MLNNTRILIGPFYDLLEDGRIDDVTVDNVMPFNHMKKINPMLL